MNEKTVLYQLTETSKYMMGFVIVTKENNVIVIDDNGVMNEGGLRFPDEFVRHKILDFIGDMAMLGKPMLGDVTVSCSGHAHNNAFLRQLDQLEGALEAVDC